MTTEQLKVFSVISPSLGSGNNVIYLQVSHLKMRITTRTIASLLTIEFLLIFWAMIARKFAQVGTLRDISPRNDIPEKSLFGFYTLCNQLYRFRTNINPYPLSPKPIGCYECCCTTTEGIKDYIPAPAISRTRARCVNNSL